MVVEVHGFSRNMNVSGVLVLMRFTPSPRAKVLGGL